MKDSMVLNDFAKMFVETKFILNTDDRRAGSIGFRFAPTSEYDLLVSNIKRFVQSKNAAHILEQILINKSFVPDPQISGRKINDPANKVVYVIWRPTRRTFDCLVAKYGKEVGYLPTEEFRI